MPQSAEAAEWEASLAEQMANDGSAVLGDEASAVSTRAPTAAFEQFAAVPGKNGQANDIDMILDIPVQLTVELGRTKIAIKNLL
ncbi:MAG TPA: flagellar motor switch protein FliN, partial [Burkholderiales bacterium]|nr:flagellar motor switch protein FliN [Burkholderiales bacterium]